MSDISDSDTESNYSEEENKPKAAIKKVSIASDSEEEEEEDDIEFEEELNEPNEEPNQRILNYVDSDEEEEEDDEEEEERDEDNLKKIDESLEKNIIRQYHPELKSYNNDEINTLTRVVRDKNGVIIDPFHKTFNFVTKYEKARILGERAKQINAGAKPFIDVPESMIDGYLIALEEFKQKKIPFIIQRPLPNGSIECWKLKDLDIL
jgi:DNA-directed RNA polymerase I, II, and III subunit RPABC2